MERLLTLDECAEKLSVSRSKVSRLIHEKKLETVKLGSDQRAAVRVRAADLEAFVLRHRSVSGEAG